MKIQFKQLGDTCSYNYFSAEVEPYKTYKGYKIFKDAEDWLYLQVAGEWNYFASMCEVRRFVRDLAI